MSKIIKVLNFFIHNLKNSIRYLLFITIILGAFTGGVFFGAKYRNGDSLAKPFVDQQGIDKYNAFFFEVYDLIKQKYWNKITDEQLNNIIKLAVEKLAGTTLPVIPNNKESLEDTLKEVTQNMDDAKKSEFYPQLADLVLSNLEPFGRSRLYSTKQTQDLSNTVKNINPDQDRYSQLGVKKDATNEEIKDAYEDKISQLQKQEKSPERDQKISETETAYNILSDENTKKRYDDTKEETTITNKIYSNRILYLQLSKFSPTTPQDIINVINKLDSTPGLDCLIIDLRGNIGGLIDGVPYLLGPFIGNDQYAYQFYTQGNKIDFKTKLTKLPGIERFNKAVILIDGASQSSAEVFASVLKKYNVGILVGEKTKGWGTVEKVVPLTNQIDDKEKYSVLLVHSITLREDGLPIQGNGVEPTINIKDTDWENKLLARFNIPELVATVKSLY